MSSSKDGDKDPSRKVRIQKRPELSNGGSLEDCLSNVFTLLELPGIKWKCFRTKKHATHAGSLIADRVLKAYSRCVQDGILCAWRRKQLPASGNDEMLPLPHFSSDTAKELWVFWYEEEPERLKEHTEELDCDDDMSSESQMNIVSYEIRTILFKALHVVLERDLTKDGFVRFGRWFTVPSDARENYLHYTYPAHTPALRLNFFVHGAHTICTSVQAQRQPTLMVLARRHLEYKGQKSFAVIVGPWSMRGVLVQDQMALLNDPEMQRSAEEEWNHWKEYLQMEEKEPEKVPEEKTKSPEPEPTQPIPHRSLLADSSDEEVIEKCEVADDEIPENIPAKLRWMYEPDISYQPDKVETPEEKEQRMIAREKRKKRRRDREERRKEIERQRADVANPEEYDSDVVTDPETEEPEPTVNDEVPKMVLLEIDGVRMLYPSKFICVTLEADRQVLESMGLRTNTVPDELVVNLPAQGRRPRNRFVVNVANPILNTLAVYQYCQKQAVFNNEIVDRSKAAFGEEPLPPIKRSLVEWKFKKNYRYYNLRASRCAFYDFYWKRLKGGDTSNDTKALYEKMCSRVQRRHAFHAYHKKRVKVRKAKYKRPKGHRTPPSPSPEPPLPTIKFIPSKKRARRMAIAEKAWKERVRKKERLAYIIFWNSRKGKSIKASQKNRAARDLGRPSGNIRGESEDETCQVDELCQEDWANFDDEHPKGIEELDVPLDTDFYNDAVVPTAETDETYEPAPFLPITYITRKPENCEFNYTPGEDMSDEQFNAIYKDNDGKWTPDMTRAEKISVAHYTFDPLSVQPGSPRPYHLQKEQSKRKNKWEAVIPKPKHNKFYKGKKCKRGLKGINEFWADKHRKREEKKKLYLAKWRKHVYNHEMKVAKWCHHELEKQMSTRSIEKALKNLQLINKKDTRSEGTKQQKFAMLKPKEKEAERTKNAPEKPKLFDALDQLDMNSYCTKFERAGPYGCGETDGYIIPDYSSSPHDGVDEESELDPEEQRNGLGEGTSDQYSEGEEVDVDVEDVEDADMPIAEVIASIGHVRTALEHIGPDGLLSPPASNEMPKGGPLSVGPPSVESQGLNQIYPTPPSVQMLQGDTAQAHSPYGGKLKSMLGMMEEDVERIAVPGGGGSIVEIEADDPETENVKKWNATTSQSKLSKFLASSCNDPIFSARKIKYSTPMTDKFKIEDKPETVTAKLVYKPMVSRNFEAPPPRAFAALVRSRIHERRTAALSLPPTSVGAPSGVHQSPMPPMFQSPTMAMPIPSPSVGPMGHLQMGTSGHPGTPGPFGPTTPTYPMGPPRPGSNFGPGLGYPPHMMAPGYHGPMRGGPGSFVSPQNPMHQPMHQQQLQMMRMQQMMHNRQMSNPGMPPGYGGPGMPPNYGPPGTPGYGMPQSGPSSVQQLNNFVNQSRFGPNSVSHPGQPPAYGMAPMIPQSPGYSQPFGGMMSPMQQHQFHQQQMHQQQFQHHMMQRNQMQQQQQMHMQQQQNQMQLQPPIQQSAVPSSPAQQILEQQQQIRAAYQNLTNKQKSKFNARQLALSSGIRPKSLQPAVFRNLKNPPDANTPIKQHMMQPYKPPTMDAPQGDSLTIAIILSDTILDLHFDVVFDSCPICSCSASIRSRDLGMYITPHEVLRTSAPGHSNMREHTIGAWSGFHVNSATTCTCGFSAIRHRYLSCSTGLFPEDANEATTLDNAVAAVAPPLDWQKRYGHRDMVWFDSKSVHDMALLDQIRQMAYSNSLGKAVSHMATMREHKRNLLAGDIEMDINVPSEYIISYVDTLELLMLGNSAIGMSMKSSNVNRNRTATAQKFLAYFHPWGLQTANEMPELETTEWIDLLGQVTPTLEGAMKQAKPVASEPHASIEGPMTWKQIVVKSIKGRAACEEDEDCSLAEPIPAVMRATEKEAIRTAPYIDQYYDQASLGPIDQPKDVMYLTIIPDDDVIYEKTVKFMENVTETYERMRLGRHIPFPASTETATRFRDFIHKYEELQKNEPPYPEQQQHIVQYALNENRQSGQKIGPQDPPVNTNPEKWARELKRKLGWQDEFDKGPTEEFNPDYEGEQEQWETPTNFRRLYPKFLRSMPPSNQREGILRVGTLMVASRQQSKHTAVGTQEFHNMTRHLNDSKGFVSRLKTYLHQMEDLVTHCLCENPAAFERHGYRYQMAVEGRLKRREKRKMKEEERLRYEAAKAEDEKRLANGTAQRPSEENDLIPGTQIGNLGPENWIDEDLEEKKRKKQKEEEMYPTEGPQAPSPVPAGMVHIPETLSEQEQAVQPTLSQLLADPIMPTNAASISWTKRDTSLYNPFLFSNQPPIPFEAAGSADTDAYATLPHVIVIYMVNPFQHGPEGHTALHMRIAILAFIRVFNSIVGRLPYRGRPQLQMEIVGMESMELVARPFPDYFNNPQVPFDLLHERSSQPDRPSDTPQIEVIRALSVAVYTHPRVFLPEIGRTISARCMTAFGPGSQLINTINDMEKINMDSFLRSNKRSKFEFSGGYRHPMMNVQQIEKRNYTAYRIPSNIVCLAPPPAVCQMEEDGKAHMSPIDEQTLFVSYCLVGADFLVATATDAQGKLIDNCIANLKPRRQKNQLFRLKYKTQVLDGMGKLWSFILGVMASDIKNWRLVVGRLGRIGHGEFRAWTHLLNKTSLLRYSGSLKDICATCKSMPTIVGTPAILSACLITLEPEPSIRLMPEFYDQESCSKKNMNFQTPGDLSCTHILTFPVGAEINLEVQDQTSDIKAEENWEFGDLDIMEGLEDGDTELMKDLGDLETPSSAAIRQPGVASMFFSEDSSAIEIQNQPLASGYYISTAPAPELPNWFWATCPSAKRLSPVHLKSSLHINITEVKNDDIAMESTKEKDKEKEKEEKTIHPLESRQTEEVLRHVLESYNALSWLNLNRETGERYSCLPIHIQHLLRLYHNVARLVS